jgi:hypothetical protein
LAAVLTGSSEDITFAAVSTFEEHGTKWSNMYLPPVGRLASLAARCFVTVVIR